MAYILLPLHLLGTDERLNFLNWLVELGIKLQIGLGLAGDENEWTPNQPGDAFENICHWFQAEKLLRDRKRGFVDLVHIFPLVGVKSPAKLHVAWQAKATPKTDFCTSPSTP